jgi:glycosyltransferase involved in cell wall biosynthesis
MIVRDEERVIERCISSVKGLIDCWAIVDTGSTDQTCNLISEALCDLPGQLATISWQGFAASRNFALRIARELAGHVLFIDADDTYTRYSPDPPVNIETEFDCDVLYAWTYDRAGRRSRRIAVISSGVDAIWKGNLHEYLDLPSGLRTRTSDALYLQYNHDGARANCVQRVEQDAFELMGVLRERPDDARSQFYLAMTLLQGAKSNAALPWLQVRAANHGGDEEERWYTSYKLAELLTIRSQNEPNRMLAAKRIAEVIGARPTRAEPCILLSSVLRLSARYAEAIEIAEYAASLSIPDDSIYVELGAFSWQAYEEIALSLAMLGDMQGAMRYAELSFDAASGNRFCPANELARLATLLNAAERELANT